jgi:nucleosome binding factor SPN SPT16 subunit
LTKEEPQGPFIESWINAIKQAELEQKDVANGFSELLAVKDAKELV